MAERYTRLFSLSENLYASSAPIVIVAGALLKDNQTGRTLAQLKFKSLSKKNIKALKVTIAASDVSGNALTGVDEYQYLDLAVERNETFGQKQAIYLPDAVTRSIAAKCTEVIFEDGTVWKAAKDAIWNTLPEQETIDDCLKELAAQYQRDTSRLSKYMLVEHEDLWLCTCGAINHNEEAACHRCNYEKAELLEAMELEGLQARKADYDRKVAEAAEKRAREAVERAEKKAAEDIIRRKKIRKVGIAAAVFLCVVVSICILATTIIPNMRINNALNVDDAQMQYENAYALLRYDSAKLSEKQKEQALGIVVTTLQIKRATWSESHDAVSKNDFHAAAILEKPITELPSITFENKNIQGALSDYQFGVRNEIHYTDETIYNEEWRQLYANGMLKRYRAILALYNEGVITLSDEHYGIYASKLMLTTLTLTSEDNDNKSFKFVGNITNNTAATYEDATITLTWNGGSAASYIKTWKPGESYGVEFVIPNNLPNNTNFEADMTFGTVMID